MLGIVDPDFVFLKIDYQFDRAAWQYPLTRMRRIVRALPEPFDGIQQVAEKV